MRSSTRLRLLKFFEGPAAILTLALVMLFGTTSALAATSSGVTYHGRIVKPDGTPLQGTSVQFQLQVRSPGNESCLLYEEVQTLDMHASGGIFSLTLNDGTGVRIDNTSIPFDKVFSNRTSFTVPGGDCASGTVYNPNSADGRSFVVSFRDETMSTFETLTAQPLNFAPIALQAKNIGGYAPENLLRFDDTTAAANLTPWSNAQYNALLGLVNGTSNLYMKAATNGTGLLPSTSTAPTTPAAGEIWYDTTSNSIKYYNGTTTLALGSGGGSGTVTSITAGTGLTGGAITTSGTIALATTGTAGSYFKVTTDAYGRVTSGNATLAESDIPTLTTAGHVAGSAISGTIGGSTIVNTTGAITTTGVVTAGSVTANSLSGQSILVYNSGNTHKTTISVPSGLSADFNFILPITAGSSGNMLITDGAGNLSWAAVSGAPTGAAGGDLAGTYPNPSVAGLRGKAISATAPTAAGQVLKYDGTSTYAPGFITMADLRSSIGPGFAQFFPASACTASQTLVYSAVSDSLSCGTLSMSAVTGVLPVANGGTGTATGSITGTGALTFTAGGTNQSVTLAPSGTGSTVLNGSVGIGTTSPTTKLQVAGSLTLGDGGETCGAGFAGAVRYNSTTIQYCNATSWITLASTSGTISSLTGDVTSTGSGAATTVVGKVNGVAYPASPATNTVPIVTGANTVTYGTVPNASLTNSSVTLGTTAVSLGATTPSLNGLTSVGLGVAGTTAGTLQIANSNASGTVTVQNPSTTAAYNFNLPATAGTSGYALTSGGGAAAPMTWTQVLPLTGATSITQLGTVTTGTWNATTIGVPYGGTGLATIPAHGVMLGEGTSNVATVVGGAGTVLQGAASADPTFTATAVLGNGTTNGALQLANTATGFVNIKPNASSAVQWSMVLPANGGTSGYFLTTDGTGTTSWQAAAGSGTVNAGTTNQLAYYQSNGAIVSGLTSTANSVLLTDGSNALSWQPKASDNFTQYALLAGRVGGQSLSGGTAASNNLTLDSTTNATKGYVLLAPTGGSVGVGTTSPQALLDVAGPIRVAPAALPGSPVAGQIAIDSGASNALKFYNGSAWQTVSNGTGFAASGANSDILSLSALTNINGTSITIGSAGTTTLALGSASTGNLTTTLGATSGTSTTTVNSGSGGVTLSSGGNITVSPAAAGSVTVGNASTGAATFGNTGAAAVTTVRGGSGASGQTIVTSAGTSTNAVQLSVTGTNGGITLAPNGTGLVTSLSPVDITPGTLPASPVAGTIAFDSGASNALKFYNGSAWQTVGTSTGNGTVNTGTLNALAYYNAAGNAVSSLTTANNSVLLTNGSGVPAWTTTATDSFTQYALLAGRAGGQSLSGGTAASENLTLDSTANATKGYVVLAPSGGNVGIGTSSPVAKLQLTSSLADSAMQIGPSAGGTSANAAIILRGQSSGTATGQATILADYSNNLSLQPATGKTTYFNTGAGTRIVTIDATGNLGIGTASPAALLDVNGTAQVKSYTANAATSGAISSLSVLPNYNQGSGTAANTDLLINRTQTAVGSGAQLLIDAQVGGISKFRVDNTGKVYGDGSGLTNVSAGSASISSLTAATATNSPDSLNFAQTWNWSTATTQNPMTMTANGLTTGSLLSLTSSNASLNSTSGLLNVANTGASTTGTVARVQSNSTAGSGLYVLANGNVGIGTANPSNLLSVTANVAADAVKIQNLNTSGYADITFFDSAGSNQMEVGYGNASTAMHSAYLYSASDLSFYLNGSTATPAVSFKASGNVGIGTTSPTSPLTVAGVIQSTTGGIKFPDGTTQTTAASAPGSASISGLTAATATNSPDSLNFAQTWNWSTATTQNPMTMTANGLTTGSLLSLTSSNASLNSASGLLNVANTGASTTGTVARVQSNSTAGSGLYVLANGNVGIGTTSPASLLDVAGPVRIAPTALPGSPVTGTLAFDSSASNALKFYDGSVWQTVGTAGGSGTVNSAAINTLAYYNAAGTAVSGLTTANSSVLLTNGTGVPAWATIATDSFTQYALLAGRAGGQSLSGGTAASNNLTLDSTTSATKGFVLLAPSGGYVGIGTTSPSAPLQVTRSAYNNIIFEATSNSVELDLQGYGTGKQGILEFTASRGTKASQTYLLAGDPAGYISAGPTGAPQSSRIQFDAAANWSGTSTPGDIYFQTTAVGATVPTTRLYIDSSGNVGIGTTTTGATLQINGASGTTLKIVDTNQGAGKVLTSDANGVASWAAPSGTMGGTGTAGYVPYFTAATTLANSPMFVTATAVGIGTTSPTSPMTVLEASAGGVMVQGVAGINGGNADFNLYSSSLNAKWDLAANNTAGLFNIYDGVNSRTPLSIEPGAASNSLYINSSGHVGVGTSSPGSNEMLVVGQFGVQGNAYIGNGAANYLELQTSATGANHISFLNGASTVMYLPTGSSTGSGNVGIGTTVPNALLDVNGTAQVSSYTANAATSGTVTSLSVLPNYNQASGTAANTDFLINRTQTAVGSGQQNLIDAQVSGVSKFRVDNTGKIYGDGSQLTNLSGSISGLTTGKLPKAGSATTIVDSVITELSSKIGIGTTSPAQTLDVAGSAQVSGSLMLSAGSSQFMTWTAGSTAFQSTVTNGSSTLNVIPNGTSTAGSVLVSGNSAYGGSNYVLLNQTGANASLTNVSTTGTLSLGTSNAARMTILSGGNVGIGTASPGAILEVKPSLVASSGVDYGVKIQPTVNASGTEAFTALMVNATETATGSGSKLLLDLQTGGTSKARIDDGGNIIGNYITTNGANISGNVISSGQFFEASGTTAASPALTLGNDTNTGIFSAYQSHVIGFTSAGSEKMRIDASGNLGIGTTSPTSPLTVAGVIQSTTGGIKFPDGTTQTTAAAGGSAAISSLTAATATNSPDSLNFAQTWNWSTASTQNPMTMTANGLTTGSLLSLTTSNNSLNSTSGLLKVANTGTSTNGMVARIQSNSTAGSGLTVLANGKVGIGTASPTSGLEVNGDITIDYGSGLYVPNGYVAQNTAAAASGAAAPSYTFVSSSDTGMFNSGAAGSHALGFSSAGVERMTISSAGNVGIGTTSPASLLDVAGVTATNASVEGTAAYVSSSTAYTIPNATINIRRVTLTANATITLPAFAPSTTKVWTLTVMVKQDATGSRTLAFTPPSGDTILWDQAASAPAPSATANTVSIYQFTKPSDETNWYASQVWKSQ